LASCQALGAWRALVASEEAYREFAWAWEAPCEASLVWVACLASALAACTLLEVR
jgi:hypothetical protein